MYFQASQINVPAVVPFGAGLLISFFTSMVGVSGAFLLVPFQMSILGIVSPTVSSTNLVFNLVATPGGIWRFARDGRLDWRLAQLVTLGTLPGLLGGWWLRTHWLVDIRRFQLFVASVLGLLAIRLFSAKGIPAANFARGPSSEARTHHANAVVALALVVGILGGAYGIGGGAIMAPVLVAALGLSVQAVAGATLLATFMTSAAGVLMYSTLPGPGGVPLTPDWPLGALFGLGGLFGMYGGALMQKSVAERRLRIGLSWLITVLALGYVLQALVGG